MTAQNPNLIKAIAKAQKEAAEREIKQVANQPHRRGDSSKLAGSNLGNFIIGNFSAENCLTHDSKLSLEDYRREIMDSCESYARVRWNWARAKGIPLSMSVAWDFGGEGDGDKLEELVKKWGELIAKYNQGLHCAGMMAFAASTDLILFDYIPRIEHFWPVRRAIQSLHMVVYG